ncbi:MAG TPA: response regulator transcription factor [Gemmataceae bacterium]
MRDPTVEGAGPPARVFVVDDHPVVREGLAAQIAAQPDLELCGQAEGVADALARVKELRPDVAVIDISLKDGNGIDLIKRLRAREDPVRVVVWSMYPENLYAERALRAGAAGYVHKGRATREILEAIRSVLAGQVYLSPDVSAQLLARMVGGGPGGRSPVEALSDRELETFGLLGRGLTTEQIAERMHLSPKTVETYRLRIKEKLGVRTVPELIRLAAEWVLENG